MPKQERPPTFGPLDPPAIEPPASPDPPPVMESEEDPDVGAQHPSAELRTSAVPLRKELTDRLAAAEGRASALEAELEAERDALRQAQGEWDGLKEQVSLAAARYREAVLNASPEVPPDLVAGDSIEEVDRSLVAARKTVDAVRRQLADRAAAERVPAGAPARGGPDLSALSPREKIALALSRSA